MKYCLLFFLFSSLLAGSSESDDEHALPIAISQTDERPEEEPPSPVLPRWRPTQQNCGATEAPVTSMQESQQASTHASDRDIEALTIKEHMVRNRVKIALIGCAATTVTSAVTLTFYFTECDQK